jgi:hypothetical protein
MAFAVNQNCRDDKGNIIIDIVNVNKQLVGNGAPSASLGQDGNVYTDALTGEQYQKQNGEWIGTVNLASVAGGVTYTSGDGITVFQDDPSPGLATVNMNQNIQTFGATGEIPYASPAGDGAVVVVRKITNNDGLLTVSADGSNAISIDNNSLVESVSAGQGIAISNPPAPFENQKTIDNTGLLNVVDVGLPAYGSIAARSTPTGPADIEIKKFGSGSNIVLTNDANGVLVATTADPEFTTVRANDRVNFGDPADGVTIARIGNNLQLYSDNLSNLINMAGTATIINQTIRKQAPPFAVDLGTNPQPFNNLYVINPPIITSDQRYKTDIQTFDMGLDFVNKLEPKSYRMADETEDGQTLHHKRRRCGLIAQDVHAAMISSGCDTSMCDILHNEKYDEDVPVGERLDKYTMSYSSLIPVLINAVKELSAKVAVLESA